MWEGPIFLSSSSSRFVASLGVAYNFLTISYRKVGLRRIEKEERIKLCNLFSRNLIVIFVPFFPAPVPLCLKYVLLLYIDKAKGLLRGHSHKGQGLVHLHYFFF